MDTLRSFVLGVIGSEFDAGGRRRFYSKPDPNAQGFEERRFRAFSSTQDSDFIEFYWQHLMPIAAWRFVLSWLWLLMRRPAKDMPPRFVVLWWICWFAFAAFVVATIASFALQLSGHALPAGSVPTLSGLAAGALAGAGAVVRSFVGDAAIYLNPHPRTVQSRNDIRQAGVDLLARLHADGRYDRIVIVGHSLGSVIGYDILNFSWQRESEALRRLVEASGPVGDVAQPRLAASEAIATAASFDTQAWRQAVYDLHFEQRRFGSRWLVTDFITLGSPVAHAKLLQAKSIEDFDRRVGEREFPTSPPFSEDGAHFSYLRQSPVLAGGRVSGRVVDHSAVFAVTAWTNLYFPCRHLFYGDLVGGEIGTVMGHGVRDVRVSTSIRGGWLAHTEYWSRFERMGPDASPLRLVEALNLNRFGLRRPGNGRPPTAP